MAPPTQLRLYPLEPLLRAMNDEHEVHSQRRLGASGTSWARAKKAGLTDVQADHWALRAGFHPGDIWPSWWELADRVTDDYERTHLTPGLDEDHVYEPQHSGGKTFCAVCKRRRNRLAYTRRHPATPEVSPWSSPLPRSAPPFPPSSATA